MASSAENWSDLVRAVAESADREAFSRLFDHFAPRLETYLQRLGLDRGAAEEIAQDAMLTLWRKAALFDPAKSSVGTWLYRIARNRRIDLSRRGRTEYLDPQSPTLTELPDSQVIDAEMDGAQRDDAVRGLIVSLPLEQRRLVELAFYQGLSHSQIAERTGMPLGTVKSRLRLAFTRLRRGLESAGIVESR